MKKLFEQYEREKMLNPGERKMLSAALELKTKTIGDVMTPITKIFMLDINTTLDEALKRTIYEQGYSRIPIFEDDPENIIGILMSRDLILANIDDNLSTLQQLSSIFVREVIAIDILIGSRSRSRLGRVDATTTTTTTTAICCSCCSCC